MQDERKVLAVIEAMLGMLIETPTLTSWLRAV
jgi:hypothetical protein